MRWVAVAAALALAGCAGGGSDGPARQAAVDATTTSTIASTTTSTTSTTVVPPVAGQAATATCPAVPARAVPDPKRPHYWLEASYRPAANVVEGRVRVRFTPDLATDQLVFRLWPNGQKLRQEGAKLDVGPVELDDAGTAKAGQLPDPTTLVVPLGRMRPAGRAIVAELPWKLTLPGATSDRIARIGDTVRLGSFFPILSWEPGIGWGRQPPTTNFAEASVSPTADFDVLLTVPADMEALVSGQRTGPTSWRAYAMRDVAASIGRFRSVSAEVGDVQVQVGVDTALADDPNVYLGVVTRSLADFATRFGPYPWPAFTLAITPELGGGIEYPGHVLQGPGTQGRTTPHEVGHQWFYGLVGNNQGRDPWLDEGLASYAEGRFLGNLGEFRSRSIPADARGRTGRPMSYWNGRSSYYRGVYVQGTQALLALGDPAKIDCALRHYVAAYAHRVARPGDLVKALEVVFPNARAVLARYGAV